LTAADRAGLTWEGNTMHAIEERLPRALGHAVNATLSLLLWRGFTVAYLDLAHWVNALTR